MSATATLTGGCFCGKQRYEVAQPAPPPPGSSADNAYFCHCSNCRRTTGGLGTPWLTAVVGDAGFRWITTDGLVTMRSSPTATRQFCGACGTQLTFQLDGGSAVDVTVCSLDEPDAIAVPMAAAAHIFVASKPAWHILGDDGRERHEGLPS